MPSLPPYEQLAACQSSFDLAWFGDQVLKWYGLNGRQDLPWKHPKSPYSIWLSEIMLQQTQVTTVIPYFKKFIAVFPTIQSLAAAPLDEVLALWAGLGYYARARNLYKTAQLVSKNWQGELPNNIVDLQTLPGIGRSTAGAIVSQAYEKRGPILEGNVRRVLSRFYGVEGWPGLKSVQEILWSLTEHMTPSIRPNDYTQGIMDIGALVCKRSKPICLECPLKLHCLAFNQDATARYPAPKPPKEKPLKKTKFVILLNKQYQILLLKRPLSGIWGGLWCLPELNNVEALALEFDLLSKKKSRRHTFTHYHLDYETYLARCILERALDYEKNYFWVTLSDTKRLGIPAPHKILLTELMTELEQTFHGASRLLCETK